MSGMGRVAVDDTRSNESARRPLAASGTSISLRAELIARGRWSEVVAELAARSPSSLAAIQAAEKSAWMDLDDHVAMVDAAAVVLGEDAMRELGRGRVVDARFGGLLYRIASSWLRSVDRAPTSLLKLAPHLWRGAIKHGGSIEVQTVARDRAVISFVGAPPQLLRSRAWQSMLEGYADGVAELARSPSRAHFEVNLGTPCLVIGWDALSADGLKR